MTRNLSPLGRRPYGAIALAMLLASTIVGCAQAPGTTLDNPAAVSGSSVPGQIDFHSFPYNINVGG